MTGVHHNEHGTMWWRGLLVFLCYAVRGATTGARGWCPKQCECNDYNTGMTTTVDCSHVGIHVIPVAPNDTTRFYLDGNQITDITPADIFSQTPSVLVLNLENNQLSGVINSSVFCSMPSLKKLNLSHNKVTSLSIPPEGGCHLLQLKVLDLSANRLHNITSNIHSLAPNLEILNLSLNDISLAMVDSGFATMTSLRNLDFYGNPLHELKMNDFAPLRLIPLQVLGLRDCRLVNIEDGAFRGLTNLTSLTLADNPTELKTLELVLREIGNHSKLTYLDLSEMQLINLTVPLLGSFPHLVHLNVADSMLERLDPRLFSFLTSLETLQLDANSLDHLEGLSQLQQLRRLYVHGNKLQELNLSNLTHLEQVDISGNRLTDIPTGWLGQLDAIKLLNISNNCINNISDGAFSTVTLHSLDLSHNNLTILHHMGGLKVNKLDVSHNNISVITTDSVDSFSSTIEELDLSHNSLSTFPQHTFTDLPLLQQLDLAHNRFGEALQHEGEVSGLFQSLSHLQILDLSYNNISSLAHGDLQHLHHLTMLYLQGNRVTDLSQLSLADTKSLAKLLVSSNDLRHIEPDVLASLSYLEILDLSANPYQCNCALLPFLHWLNTTAVTVQDITDRTQYTCHQPPSQTGLYILDYTPSQGDCVEPSGISFNRNMAIIAIPVACLLGAIVFVGMVFCYGKLCHRIKSLHYRWQIRYREVSGVEIAGDSKV